MKHLVPVDSISQMIFWIRGHKVMFDSDLASLYGVPTGRLNEAYKRNIRRFPEEFAFRLTAEEHSNLISQIAISRSWGGTRHHPVVFTEHGALMLSSVLNSPRAEDVCVEIMRAFVSMRGLFAKHKELAHKLAELENKYNHQFKAVFDAIRELMEPPTSVKKGRLGFQPPGARGARGRRKR